MLTQTFKILILFVMMLSGVANAIAEEFMYVYRCKVMVGDSLCYLVKQGHSCKNNNWNHSAVNSRIFILQMVIVASGNVLYM